MSISPGTCERCGTALDNDGYCIDETCPHSDHPQTDEPIDTQIARFRRERNLDPVYRDYALAAGRLLLNWAGLEDESGTRLNGEGLAEEFVEALGNSSIPEAAGTVADAIRRQAAEDNKRVVQQAAAVYAAPPANVAEGYTEREFEARDRAMETLSEWALVKLREEADGAAPTFIPAELEYGQ